jgi:hypothetical protein
MIVETLQWCEVTAALSGGVGANLVHSSAMGKKHLTAEELAELQKLPVEDASPDELAAYERGWQEHSRAELVTLDQLEDELAADRRKGGAQKPRAASR